MSSFLDHIVITAPELGVGVSRVEAALGVSLMPGGTHPGMGTHNYLLRLSESTYLEVIAPDPDAARLAWPRWFNLDRVAADSSPLLAGWVAHCDDIHVTQATCAEVVGPIQHMTRGDLAWQITVRHDGGFPLDGAAPALIEWQKTAPHPATTLADAGCSLVELQLYHPDPERVYGILTSMAMQARPTVHWSGDDPAYLVAIIDTPAGKRTLSGRL